MSPLRYAAEPLSEGDDQPRVDDIAVRRVARIAEFVCAPDAEIKRLVDLAREHEVERNEPRLALLAVCDRVLRIQLQRPLLRERERRAGVQVEFAYFADVRILRIEAPIVASGRGQCDAVPGVRHLVDQS